MELSIVWIISAFSDNETVNVLPRNFSSHLYVDLDPGSSYKVELRVIGRDMKLGKPSVAIGQPNARGNQSSMCKCHRYRVCFCHK